MTTTEGRLKALLPAAVSGAGAGLLGVVIMTTGEKLEQLFTRRANSYVPARTLMTLFGAHPTGDDSPWIWNHAMHWGTGAVLGALRGVWAEVGLRGPRANIAHTVVRLATDQTLENATGVGAPPRTWPLHEQVVDIGHKAVYSFATGVLADKLIQPKLQSERGIVSH
jgi:hypothetical protein